MAASGTLQHTRTRMDHGMYVSVYLYYVNSVLSSLQDYYKYKENIIQ